MLLTGEVSRSGPGGKTGLQLVAQGTNPPLMQSRFADAGVSEIQAKYQILCENGYIFSTFYASGAVAAASATVAGAFELFNPPNSGVNLVLINVMAQVVTFTPGTTGAGFGFQAVANQQPTTTTPGNTPTCAMVGSAVKSSANVFTVGTIVGAPTTPFYLIGGAYLDLAAGDIASVDKEIAGAVQVAPGSGICIVSSGTLVANLTASITWAEIPS